MRSVICIQNDRMLPTHNPHHQVYNKTLPPHQRSRLYPPPQRPSHPLPPSSHSLAHLRVHLSLHLPSPPAEHLLLSILAGCSMPRLQLGRLSLVEVTDCQTGPAARASPKLVSLRANPHDRDDARGRLYPGLDASALLFLAWGGQHCWCWIWACVLEREGLPSCMGMDGDVEEEGETAGEEYLETHPQPCGPRAGASARQQQRPNRAEEARRGRGGR